MAPLHALISWDLLTQLKESPSFAASSLARAIYAACNCRMRVNPCNAHVYMSALRAAPTMALGVCRQHNTPEEDSLLHMLAEGHCLGMDCTMLAHQHNLRIIVALSQTAITYLAFACNT